MAQAMLVTPSVSGHSVDVKRDNLLQFQIQRLSPRPASFASLLRFNPLASPASLYTRPVSSPTVALFKSKTKAPPPKKVDN